MTKKSPCSGEPQAMRGLTAIEEEAIMRSIFASGRPIEYCPPADEQPVEVWRGDRKVTVYANTVIRVWGTNIETEMSAEPRTHGSVGAAMDWLYGKSDEA